jgi:hypothetical protein
MASFQFKSLLQELKKEKIVFREKQSDFQSVVEKRKKQVKVKKFYYIIKETKKTERLLSKCFLYPFYRISL